MSAGSEPAAPRLSAIVARWCVTLMRSDKAPVVLFVFLAHGLLLINTGVYHDGWLIGGYHFNKDTKSMHELFHELGNPGTGYLHLLIGRLPFPTIVAYKLVSFASILCCALFLKRIMERTGWFRAGEILFLPLFLTCYTAFQIYVEISVIPYVIYYAVFLGAMLALLKAGGDRSGRDRRWYGVAFVAFAISFQLASLLPVYFAALLVVVAVDPLLHRHIRRFEIYRLLQKYGPFAVLPFVYFAIKETFLVPYGMYVGYNRPGFELEAFRQGLAVFISNSIVKQFADCLSILLHHPLTAGGLGALLLLARRRLGPEPSSSPLSAAGQFRNDRRHIVYMLVFAAGLLFLTMGPYVAVGKPATATGWDSRHALLVGLPVGLALLAMGRGFDLVRPAPMPFIVPLVSAGLLAGFLISTWNIYLGWQLRWVKDRAVIAKLQTTPPETIADVGYVYVDNHNLLPETPYIYIDYSGIFKDAWNDEKRIGNTAGDDTDLIRLSGMLPLPRYLLRNFKPGGCSSQLRIVFNAARLSRGRVIRTYFWSRLGGGPARTDFLRSLVDLSWTSLTDKRISDLLAYKGAFEAFKAANGAYPAQSGVRAGDPVSAVVGRPSASKARNWVDDLVPKYLPMIAGDPRTADTEGRYYLFLTDGVDFKIVAHSPEDVACVTTRRPEMADPRRPTYAYGFWTPGAANW